MDMKTSEGIVGAVGVVLTALLLTYGNVLMEIIFEMLGI